MKNVFIYEIENPITEIYQNNIRNKVKALNCNKIYIYQV